jgi:hypothetical protein
MSLAVNQQRDHDAAKCQELKSDQRSGVGAQEGKAGWKFSGHP